MSSRFVLPCALAVACVLRTAVPAGGATPADLAADNFAAMAAPFLIRHCVHCHAGEDPAGGLSLGDLGPVDELNADTWKSVWAQVSLQEMPPQEEDQPSVVERVRLADWIVGELQRALQAKGGFRDHMDPSKGNFLAHSLLFGELPDGLERMPSSSPARLWRVTREEHMTRLNELINTEPSYDPSKPGLRTHGDGVPTNHGGELKLYFGTDRILKWQGGTVAYATAVKSLPAILSPPRDHGLKNYPDLVSVNGAEATQIMAAAGDILRYMAYGPLSIANPEQITDDPNSYVFEGDLRGLPTSIVYSTKVVRPMTPVYDLFEAKEATEPAVRAAVDFLFEALTFRPPTPHESDTYLAVVMESIASLGREEGAILGLSAIFLDRDALFRSELVEEGEPDPYGRVMLRDWELALAVNHALRYLPPDEPLRRAVLEGRMRSREDVQREV
ncbi:MAG: c-type cytochrome domain-containing protein [Pirellulales bacterium]